MTDKSTGMWAESAPVTSKAVNTESILILCDKLVYGVLRDAKDNDDVPQCITRIRFFHEETADGHVFSAVGYGVPR